MVNWTDHGALASLKGFKWVNTDNGAWDAQCVRWKKISLTFIGGSLISDFEIKYLLFKII